MKKISNIFGVLYFALLADCDTQKSSNVEQVQRTRIIGGIPVYDRDFSLKHKAYHSRENLDQKVIK